MDSKGVPSSDKDNGLGMRKLEFKAQQSEQNAASKQTSSSGEPKQRVIKQIVSLDSKKLKALGIESNILSALTKFNVKEKKPATTVKNIETSTSTQPKNIVLVDNSSQNPSTIVANSSTAPSNSIQNRLSNRSPKSSPKKIQVLSNVLLNENKLDLKIFPAITSPVHSKKCSYVSPVCVDINELTAPSTSAIIHPENEQKLTINNKTPSEPPESIVKLSEKSPNKLETLREKTPEKCTEKTPAKLIDKSPIKLLTPSPLKPLDVAAPPKNETVVKDITALKGFSLPELKCSRNQFDHLQNVHSNENNDENQSANENDSDTLNESLHNTDMSNSSQTSDSWDSDSESDLDELIKEAQLTIEKEQAFEVTNKTESQNITKKPRLVQKKFLDMLTEHVDKDRLIDEFLDSTINSFRTECNSPSDSDSDDDRIEFDSNVGGDLKNDHIEPMEDSIEIKSTNITNDSKCAQNERSHAEEKNSIVPRKRKCNVVPEDSSKRKKAQSTDNDNNENAPVEIPETITNVEKSIDDSNLNQVPESLNETVQESSDESSKNTFDPSPSLEAISQPVISKRGRKPKQTILNDYFVVQNSILNATKQSLDELMSRENITSEPPKRSSRFGRVIKPKTFDIEPITKVKKVRKELLVEAKPEPQKEQHIDVEIKTESMAPKPLKKRGRDKKVEYIIPDIDIPAHECVIEPVFNTEYGESFASSTPIVQSTRGRRKSIKQVNTQPIDAMPETVSHENISFDSTDEQINTPIVIEPTVIPRRRGRPPKKSITAETLRLAEKSNVSTDIEHTETPEIIQLQETPIKDAPKRRGRKPNYSIIESSNETIQNTSNDNVAVVNNNSNVSQDDHFKSPQEIIPKRRGRKSASATNVSFDQTNVSSEETNVSSDENIPSTSQEIPTPKKKRGRPKQFPTNCAKFICGNCELEIFPSKWRAHVAIHFGVTYRKGIDEPIDVHDSNTQVRLMTRFMKVNKVQYVKCPKCNEKKKSALGYLSHVEICGLTDEEAKQLKAKCEFCQKLYRKVSLASHQQTFCPVRRLEMAQQQADQLVKTAEEDEQVVEVVYSESGRPKRMIKKRQPIAKNADEFIKIGLKITGGTFKNWSNQLREENFIKCTNDSCEYIASDLVEIRKHYLQCRESILQCRICFKTERSRNAIVQHIETSHPEELKAHESEEDDNDNDDDFKGQSASSSSSDGEFLDEFDIQSDRRRKNKPLKRKHVIPLKRIMEEDCPVYWEMLSAFYTRLLNSRPGFNQKSYVWTKEFVEQNYDHDSLALKDHLRNTFEIVRLPQREVNKFLGLLRTKSAKFLCRTQNEYQREKSELNGNEDWNNLNLFESVQTTHTKNKTSILFCGGKVITADWIPFPQDYNGNQMLAIVSQGPNTKPVSETNCQPTEKCKSLIQIWSISTNSTGKEIEKTAFMYGIAYEDGPIGSISFCPSDAYVASKRLAIVAVPDTNGNVNIISIPDNVSKAKTNTSTVIKLKADIRLQIGLKNEENTPKTITQLSWSRTKGHKVICAGYNTGLIAIWNFDHLNSTYMTHKGASHDISILLPQYTLMGSLSLITQLDIRSDNDGNVRWILVGSLDRRMRLYDLEDPQLAPFTSPIFKSRIISGTWPLNWPIYLTIIDAALTQQNGGLHIKPILYTNNQPTSTNLLNECEPSNIGFSDWLNTGIFGNEVGDLFMINFQQLLLHDRFDESSEQKVLSCTDIFLDEQTPDEDQQANTNVCILFNDFENTVLSPKMNTRSPILKMHPFGRITRVAINPNESQQKLYAIGYELGFCRIQFIPG